MPDQQRHINAYDIAFGPTVDQARTSPSENSDLLPLVNPVLGGWIGDEAAGLTAEQWPRSPLTGLPMWHVITLWVPPEYRTQGEHLVGLSFFAGEGQFAEADDDVAAVLAGQPLTTEQAEDPFLVQLSQSVGHEPPTLRRMTDVIDGQFALLWLTAEQLGGPRSAPPPDPRQPGQREANDDGNNAWDDRGGPAMFVWTGMRVGDQNAGIAPSDDVTGGGQTATNGYRLPAFPRENHGLTDDWPQWCESHVGRCHFGGTSFPVQAIPEGMSPFYLELEEFSFLNFGGGGVAQIDLLNDVFDWACG